MIRPKMKNNGCVTRLLLKSLSKPNTKAREFQLEEDIENGQMHRICGPGMPSLGNVRGEM